MAVVVNHNLSGMNANRNLQINNNALTKSLEKLSSGKKINRAADDASGLSISEKMRGQIRGLDQASANSEDAVSLIQTADGALATTHEMLQRMRELAVKADTGTLADDDVTAIKDEMITLASGITDIADRTEFNTKKLLNSAETITIQTGANSGQTTELSMANMKFSKLSSGGTAGMKATAISSANISDNTGAFIAKINDAITAVSKQRSKLGAKQNQLEYSIQNLDNTSENLTNAESHVRDTDMAKEMMNYTKLNILTQAAQSMLSQANSKQQNVMSLLQ